MNSYNLSTAINQGIALEQEFLNNIDMIVQPRGLLSLLLVVSVTLFAAEFLNATEVKSEVEFKWLPVERATHYVVVIARDPTFQRVETTIDTAQTSARSQPLRPGAYYWTVDAFDDMQHLHRLEPKPLVVGSPFQISAENTKLPAPQTLSPGNDALVAPVSKIRLAWARVAGAKQYFFRLWDEDNAVVHKQIKKKSHLRWETTLDQPWIVLHDAPYTSFMYLDQGNYRWEVAGLDADSHQVGDFSTGRFEVHKKVYFKPKTHTLLGRFIFGPRYFSKFVSAPADTSYQRITTTYGGYGSWTWWADRQFGTRVAGEVNAVLRSHAIRKLHLEGRFRHKITNSPKGWHFELGLGGAFIQVPHLQVDETDGDEAIDIISSLGPFVEASFVHQFESPFTTILGLRTVTPLLLVSTTGGGGSINRAFDIHLFNEWRWHTSKAGFVSGILDLFITELRYQPNSVQTSHSLARFFGPSLQIGVGLLF